MSKITRYTCDECDDGNGLQADMFESRYGSYVSYYDLQNRLKHMLEDACDPGEKDAINKMLDLLKE
jgi:hypothetical protein